MDGQGFETWTLDRLSQLGEITVRPMFGGQGIYWRGMIFGMVFQVPLDVLEDREALLS